MLRQGQTAFASFMLLKGVRAAQVMAHSGLDVGAEILIMIEDLMLMYRP